MRAPGKRRATLADRFLHRKFSDWERAVHPKSIEQLKRGVRDARRFVLSEDAVRRLFEVITKVPDLLVREQQFARAPYDLTWIEYPCHVMWKLFREHYPEDYAMRPEVSHETADHTIGYLIDHERLNIVCGGTVEDPDKLCNIMPVQYRMHTEWHPDDRADFMRRAAMTEDWHLETFLWGSTWHRLAPKDRGALATRCEVSTLPSNPLHHNHDRWLGTGEMFTAAKGSMGELRNAIAILLMMNRPSLTRYVHSNDATKGFVRGKLMPFLSHTVVTIDLDAIPTLKLIGTPSGEAVEKRRHEVRGHYKHDETAREYSRIAGCIHEFRPTTAKWEPWQGSDLFGSPGTPGAPRNWMCAACGGKRWWTKKFERGNAELGFVSHDGYEIGTAADRHRHDDAEDEDFC